MINKPNNFGGCIGVGGNGGGGGAGYCGPVQQSVISQAEMELIRSLSTRQAAQALAQAFADIAQPPKPKYLNRKLLLIRRKK